jgi:hypothetical protein
MQIILVLKLETILVLEEKKKKKKENKPNLTWKTLQAGSHPLIIGGTNVLFYYRWDKGLILL